LLESAYKTCLSYEFVKLGLKFVKSVEKLLPIHTAQVMTYLRLTGARHLLLLNFNCLTLKEGLKSFVGTGIRVPQDGGPG